jgi:hypothetical protein
MLKIDKDVPPPRLNFRFDRLKPGESVLIVDYSAQIVRSALTYHRKRCGKNVRFQTKCQEGGIRVWRVQA